MHEELVVRYPTLVDQLVERICERVLRGDIRPGQRVTEEHLAAAFGVSRTPVREAVKRLAEMGVVVVFPRHRMEAASVSGEDLCQINQLREDLECLAIAYALPRMSDEEVAGLERLVNRCDRLAQSGSRFDTFCADSDFHLGIAAHSGNKYLMEALQRIDVKVQLCRSVLCLPKDKIRASVAFHQRILQAIRKRDVGAAQELMRQHIRSTLKGFKGANP